MIVIVNVLCGLEIKWVNFEIATEILRPGLVGIKITRWSQDQYCGLEISTHGLGIGHVILKSVDVIAVRLVFHQFME